jgi:hypothetical protein
VDWYRQRADDCDDPELRKILLHNAREELEHAAMVLEWLRRSDPETDEQLKEYLFTEGSITGREEEATASPRTRHPGPCPPRDVSWRAG